MSAIAGTFSRFEHKYIPEPNSGCWLWVGSADSSGYGNVRVGGRAGRTISAHRLSWQLHYGAVPDGAHVLHKCDVRCCVNPDHLFLGTNADNVADKISKGRQPRGERMGNAKLTAEQVRAIRADPRSQRVIAADYGVKHAVIGQIKRRGMWTHV